MTLSDLVDIKTVGATFVSFIGAHVWRTGKTVAKLKANATATSNKLKAMTLDTEMKFSAILTAVEKLRDEFVDRRVETAVHGVKIEKAQADINAAHEAIRNMKRPGGPRDIRP